MLVGVSSIYCIDSTFSVKSDDAMSFRNSKQPQNPSSEKYFFGRISREEAEKFLKEAGLREGMYLLREKVEIGNYALSICHDNKIHHYSIEKQHDGKVMITDGRRFDGPVDLINHHRNNLDGFLTKPTFPCERPSGYPMAWPGVTYKELETAIYKYAEDKNLKGHKLENILGPQRQKVILKIAKDYHKKMPWFHGKISREESEKLISESRHFDGKYLVREKTDGSFALSLSYQNDTKHYKIKKEKHDGHDKLAIEDGPRFDSVMDMIAHYHNKTDGLLCKLNSGVPNRNASKNAKAPLLSIIRDHNPAYGIPGEISRQPNGAVSADQMSRPRRSSGRPLPQPPCDMSSVWDEPEHKTPVREPLHEVQGATAAASSTDDEIQKIYDVVPRTDEVFNLNRHDLELHNKLGGGNFGEVLRGTYKRKGEYIPVAVKTLKSDDISKAEAEIMTEAKVMAGLQHRNIVRLIGVCTSEVLMLVMELANLGPLNKYLKTHPHMPMSNVIELMFQVAEGMAYLESKNFVHRDLAARNVLLVSDTFAKISDFGMSKALGRDSNYYKAEQAGKWPLKWYAPECIYYFKFDTKSDIWSYGVTLWEAVSYGNKPYKSLKGQEILEKIERGERLDKPNQCPIRVYELMCACWSYDKDERPTFRELADDLRPFRPRNADRPR